MSLQLVLLDGYEQHLTVCLGMTLDTLGVENLLSCLW